MDGHCFHDNRIVWWLVTVVVVVVLVWLFWGGILFIFVELSFLNKSASNGLITPQNVTLLCHIKGLLCIIQYLNNSLCINGYNDTQNNCSIISLNEFELYSYYAFRQL